MYRIHGIVNTVSSFAARLARLRSCLSGGDLSVGSTAHATFKDAATASANIAAALQEINEALSKHRELERKPTSPGDLTSAGEFIGELQSVQRDLERVCASVRSSTYKLFGRGECSKAVDSKLFLPLIIRRVCRP
jgi:hypothetical protein